MPGKLNGKIIKDKIKSEILGVEKPFSIYLPEKYESLKKQYPVIYLFHNQQDAWADKPNDQKHSPLFIADKLISSGKIAPVLLVEVYLSSDDKKIPGLGINFLNPDLAKDHSGIGTGQFEDFLVQEFIPFIDKTFRTKPEKSYRAVNGAFLGGFLSAALVLRHPEQFGMVATYDSNFMWKNLIDPRRSFPSKEDRAWLCNEIFYPAFMDPRTGKLDKAYMMRYSAANLLDNADPETMKKIHQIRFYIQCGVFGSVQDNRDRSFHLVAALQKKGLLNEAECIILKNKPVNKQIAFTNYIKGALLWHHNVFTKKRKLITGPGISKSGEKQAKLYENYPNPFEFVTMIPIELKQTELINLRILDDQNREVDHIIERRLPDGRYSFIWEASDYEPGYYFVSLQSGHFETRKKIFVLRHR